MLETRIRLATPADGSALAAIYAPSVIGNVTSFELEAPDSDAMGRRIARVTSRTLAPHDASPGMPLSLPDLRDLPILSAALASGLPLLHLGGDPPS